MLLLLLLQPLPPLSHLDQRVEKLHGRLHVGLRVGAQAEGRVEHLGEKLDESLAGALAHVVQRLAGIIPHARVLVRERREDGRHDLAQVLLSSGGVAQADGRSGQAEQGALSVVGLRRERKVGDQAVDERAHARVVLRRGQTLDDLLDLERGGLALLVAGVADQLERRARQKFAGRRHCFFFFVPACVASPRAAVVRWSRSRPRACASSSLLLLLPC